VIAGRHRRTSGPRTGLRAFAVTLAVIVVLAGALFGYRQLTSGSDTASGCGDPLRLSVAVTPELAPVVMATATEWTRSRPTVGNRCIVVDLVSAESSEIAAAIAARANLALSGVGNAGGQAKVPQVWIPDSSSWLQRLRAVGPDLTPASGQSIAKSPVVLGVPQPVATSAFGWPANKLTWADLVKRMNTGPGMRAGIVEPTRDSAGLAGLVSISVAANAVGGSNGAQVTAATLRGLVIGRSTVREDLLQRFPKAADPASLANGIQAAPLSEQTVNAFNAKSPPVPLVSVYAEPAPPALDYPYTILPGVDADRSAAATRLRAALTGPALRDRLGAAGLRAADGSTGKAFPAAPGAPVGGGQGGASAEQPIVDKILTTWGAMTAPARTLAVFDVSGSMLRPVPTAGNATRMAVLLDAAKRGLSLFDDTWSLGLWLFSTELDGPKDYQQVIPIGPLSSQRQQIVDALGKVKPKPLGDTGLYDTIFAGYQALQDGWQQGMVNTLIVMTDGENDDPKGGLSLEQLVAEIGKIKDPKRPVRILLITIGPDAKPELLKPITDLSSGGVFSAPDPAKISDIFLQAITTRAA
jgi:Ca-activated chloride channel homolog